MGRDSLRAPRDAYGYSLYYFGDGSTILDYTSISGLTPFNAAPAGLSSFNALYNGNIAAMSTNIPKLTDPWHYYTYRYDQLNRVKGDHVYKVISTATPVTDYQEHFTYDGNGNILTANRNMGAGTRMDSLVYNYPRSSTGRLNNNKLNYLTDAVTTHTWPYGLDNQNVNNYTYDAIGNMTADVGDTVSNIGWTVYGKIQGLTNHAGTISYSYDPSGQRVTKTANGIITYYVRDAQGNILATYDNKASQVNLREIDLYGSSRLGTWQPNIVVSGSNELTTWDTVGRKSYELTNHLGNVWATITDKRLQHSTNGTTVDYFNTDISTAQEYYAFGGLMPGRTYSFSNNYPYGFNGKRNDNDVKGTGNQQDYGMRIYDPRAGKFLSVDPITAKYPELTPYQFASNSPIANIDEDGLEATPATATDANLNAAYEIVNKYYDPQHNLKPIPEDKVLSAAMAYWRTSKGKQQLKTAGDLQDFLNLVTMLWDDSYMSDFEGPQTGAAYRRIVTEAKTPAEKAAVIRTLSTTMESEMLKFNIVADNLKDWFFTMAFASMPGNMNSYVPKARGDFSGISGNILYRVVRDDENIIGGIVAKNPEATYTLDQFVRNGTRMQTQYIATTRSYAVAKAWAAKGGFRIVAIDATKIEGTIIDLTKAAMREETLENPIARNYAKKSEEVIIKGKIPAKAITKLSGD